jgi:endo-1,3-1,4-beta-glycanase ExoK
MRIIRYLMWSLTLLVLLISVMPSGATTYPRDGMINWKGQDWSVTEGHSNPGNNYWDNTGNGVWVDDQNQLHLTIKNNNGVWKCTGVSSEHKYRYGIFTWSIASPIFNLDKNSVLGLFTYQDDNHELDIEAASWGESSGNRLWYSVQPYKTTGAERGYPANVGGGTKHRIEWRPNYIRFTSWSGGSVIADYTYTNVDGIPIEPQQAMMNFWLNNAQPSYGKDMEVIISDFSYSP